MLRLPILSAALALTLIAASCAEQKPRFASELEGSWDATFRSTTKVGTNGVACVGGTGHFSIVEPLLFGFAHSVRNRSYTVAGTPTGPTSVKGEFFYNDQLAGTFEGTYANGRFNGTFADADNCRGTWTAKREAG